jgi:hypothetical protein
MPFPTLYPTIIVMIGNPWSWSIAPMAISAVMQIRPTSAIAAFDGLNAHAQIQIHTATNRPVSIASVFMESGG